MGFQVTIPFIQDTDKARDFAYAMLAGKMLTTIVSLFLGVALVGARQTLIARTLNQKPMLLSIATVEPFWSTGADIFKKTGLYSRFCLLLVMLSSWGFLSGFLLPIGIVRPDVCPFTETVGPVRGLTHSPLAAATFSTRLGEWFQVYAFQPTKLPSSVLISSTPVNPNWKYVPAMETGTLKCESVANPPDVDGIVGVQGFSRFVSHNQAQLTPWINTVTGWNVPLSSIRNGNNYQFYPLEALVDGRQQMAWASGLGFYSFSRSANNFEVLIPVLGSRNAVILWADSETNATRPFTFNRNKAWLCKANWKASRSSPVVVLESEKAAAVYGDQIHGKTLGDDLVQENLDRIQQISAAVIMSHFAATSNTTTEATFGREISCLFITDGILAYYGVGIVLLVGSLFISMAGTGQGSLRKSDIPITGLGWVHFVNNIYHPEWKVGVKESKELYLIPPEVDVEGKESLPKMLVLQGNQVVLPPGQSVHTLNEQQQPMQVGQPYFVPQDQYAPVPIQYTPTSQYQQVPEVPKESGSSYPGQYTTKTKDEPVQSSSKITEEATTSYPGAFSTKQKVGSNAQQPEVGYVPQDAHVPQQAQIITPASAQSPPS